MVKARPRRGPAANVAARPAPNFFEKPLVTRKGTFKFTAVADGVYVEHKWAQNSGHIGIPKEAIGSFVKYLTALDQLVNPTSTRVPGVSRGQGVTKARGGRQSPRAASAASGASGASEAKKRREKKEPPAKPTLEQLDAELTGYLNERVGAAPAAEEPAPADI